MKSIWGLLVVSLIAMGCSPDAATTAASRDASATSDAGFGGADDSARDMDESADDATAASDSAAAADPAPTGPVAREVPLTPQNTQIRFVGIHTGDKPDPREGTFEAFQGKAVIQGDRLASVEVTIDATSLTTQIDRLTNHLKSADFFDVNEYPEASFRSTRIESQEGASGQVTVTGELTLHGVTRPITFPASVSTEEGLELKAEFSIDRTDFGMTYGEGRVVAEVSLSVSIDA
jgi:polyisoprenoid-binding protein YceI